MAMAMRLELMSPALSFFAPSQDYNTVFSIHGSLMLFAVPVVEIVGGFGNYFVPLMIGAEDMVFPRLNGVRWWFVRPGVFPIRLSPLLVGFQTGCTGSAPVAGMKN